MVVHAQLQTTASTKSHRPVLQVDILILPAIKLVDGHKGMVPIPLVIGNIVTVQGQLKAA